MTCEMTPERWESTRCYIREVFGTQDPGLAGIRPRALAAGLPDIAVDAEDGHLLGILTALAGAGQGARLALELGTLAGYSTIWIARGLAPGGRLITLELDAGHAAHARRELDSAGVGDRVQVREGAALELLPGLAAELGEGSVDLAFLDAVKTEYPAYFDALRALIAPGGVLVADNVLGTGDDWIDTGPGVSPSRDAIDLFNRKVAAHPDFEATMVPLRQGVLVARRRRG